MHPQLTRGSLFCKQHLVRHIRWLREWRCVAMPNFVKTVEPLSRYGDPPNFKMVTGGHLGFIKIRVFNMYGSEGQYASLMQHFVAISQTMAEIWRFLWSPYGIGQTIIFLPCGFFYGRPAKQMRTLYFYPVISSIFFLSFFISSPNLSRSRLDVCHTSTHGVAVWP